jgi:three-Cys-motif partner protein
VQKKDPWRELEGLDIVRNDDSLPVRDVGSWTVDKLWWWNRYIRITTTSMTGKLSWAKGLVYVDLFAGPGVLRLKESQSRVPGSPIIAAGAPKPFSRILLCEIEPEFAQACETRLERLGVGKQTHVFCGDCNERIGEIRAQIPTQTLTLAFVDPPGLHAKFETIKRLTSGRNVDLLILFADYMDIVRNVERYADQQQSNLDEVLGKGTDWRRRWSALPNHSSANVSRLFLEIYSEQLTARLGYRHVANEVLALPKGAPLYRILYATKHERGLDFWKKSTVRERGSKRLF